MKAGGSMPKWLPWAAVILVMCCGSECRAAEDWEFEDDKMIGTFEMGNVTDTTFCRYKVVGLTGAECPVANGDTICVPCETKKDCYPETVQRTAIIVAEGGAERLCDLILESVSEDCESCPEQLAKVHKSIELGAIREVDDREPREGEEFCLFRVARLLDRPKRRKCPVKLGKTVCIACPESQKCLVQGVERIVVVRWGPEPGEGCLVLLKSRGESCKVCGERSKILKEWQPPG